MASLIHLFVAILLLAVGLFCAAVAVTCFVDGRFVMGVACSVMAVLDFVFMVLNLWYYYVLGEDE